MTSDDLGHVSRIAAEVHPDFFEEDEVFAERRDLYPMGARMLVLAGRPSGYVLSHPWRSGELPALNARLGNLPPDATTYYLHDLALLPAARGGGAGRSIVEALAEHAAARGFPAMGLVAVNGSQPFWRRLGFAVESSGAELARKLASYGADASYMVRRLA